MRTRDGRNARVRWERLRTRIGREVIGGGRPPPTLLTNNELYRLGPCLTALLLLRSRTKGVRRDILIENIDEYF